LSWLTVESNQPATATDSLGVKVPFAAASEGARPSRWGGPGLGKERTQRRGGGHRRDASATLRLARLARKGRTGARLCM